MRHRHRRPEGDDRPRHPIRDEQPGGAGEQREEQALGQELADEAAARRAERQPDRHLVTPGRRARQQQVRDVGAGDQQHQADHRHRAAT